MKGLFVKDLMLMRMQWRFFVLISAIALIMGFSSTDSTFILGYITFVLPMFALSTISYDDFDGGSAFLFTLPITRKMYVYEKYLFSIILGASAFIVALLFSALINISNMSELVDTLIAAPSIFAVMAIILSLMLPLQLKFGVEKARIVTIAIGGAVFVLGFALVKLAEALPINTDKMLLCFSSLNTVALIISIAALTVLSLLISLKISIKIMNNKEF